MHHPTHDVAVVGAGPGGSAAALKASQLDLDVVLIDGGPRALPNVGESVPAAAEDLLGALDLRDLLEDHERAAGNVSAWGGPRLEIVDALHDGKDGWHLDRRTFDASLRARAVQTVSRVIEARVRDVEVEADAVVLRTDDALVRARMVVDATGRHARVAHALGARRVADDDLVALCCWAKLPEASEIDRRTLLETCPAGWWSTAALPDGTRSVVLHTDADVARKLVDPSRWQAMLRCTRHVRRFVEDARWLARPRLAPAHGGRLDSGVGARYVAVGDAALSFDPIASQGIVNALGTGMRGAEAIAAHLAGDPVALTDYADRLSQIRAGYLERRRRAYAAETRWLVAPFWHQRIPVPARAG